MAEAIDKRTDPRSNKSNGSKTGDTGGKKWSVPTVFGCPELGADIFSKDACSTVVAALLPVPEVLKWARTTRIEETRINKDITVMPNLIKLLDISDSFSRRLSR